MAESIGILIVFFFILVFGFSFYSKISETQYSSKRQEDLSKKAIDLAQIIAFFPEVKCSLGTEEEVIVTDVCIDKYKLESVKKVIVANPDYYYKIIMYANVTVWEIYPDKKNWILYYKVPTVGESEFYSRKTRIYIPVSLYNATAETKLSESDVNTKYAFGYMVVEAYLK